ncbi:hypothetical protein [Azospirillum sp. B510]|uniref:hypothetical protein n=1 Tax=Alphaproteobacteria TaxID=28211 RepID=UPI0002EB6F4E|nr:MULTISPECIES: hypothetical protein [Alphaproteobacteria]
MSLPAQIMAEFAAAEARTLAARFMTTTPRTVGDVAAEMMRLLGHKPRKCASGLIWSDVLALVATLAAESPTYAAALRRAVAAAEQAALPPEETAPAALAANSGRR